MQALLLVDIQNDFLPGGALAVPEGDQVIPVANTLMEYFPFIVATQDWHPPDHLSFASQHPGKKVGDIIELEGLTQVLWPDHCIQNTPGADLAPGLNRPAINHIIHKGTDRHIDSYSAFFDNGHRKATGLHEWLRSHGIRDLFVVGLATDYCVKATVLDACQLGYRVYVVRQGIRGVDLNPGDCQRAIQTMLQAGAGLVDLADVQASLTRR